MAILRAHASTTPISLKFSHPSDETKKSNYFWVRRFPHRKQQYFGGIQIAFGYQKMPFHGHSIKWLPFLAAREQQMMVSGRTKNCAIRLPHISPVATEPTRFIENPRHFSSLRGLIPYSGYDLYELLTRFAPPLRLSPCGKTYEIATVNTN